uniref:Uncharacterized protein n=1 Tax=Plectus sambesii TaxID=2011161 RepID=A0A914WZR4_9BILA
MAGLVGLTGDRTWTVLSFLLVLAHILRLVQVCLQSGLLLLAEKLKIEDVRLRDQKPGKQVITFLLVANVALFLMNTFEAQKAGISPEIVHFYGIQSWVMFVRSCAPLTIFYRFHSSVCFAEVWKHCYTVKEHDDLPLRRARYNTAP